MKTLKCPLCGNEMQLRSDEVCSGYYVQLYYYECIGCPLATTPVDTTKEAENQIKDLISRFPPIMRVWRGDKLVCSGSIYPVTIVSLDIDLCKITVRNDAGDAFIIYCEEVDQWPWELEQKGGSHEADA